VPTTLNIRVFVLRTFILPSARVKLYSFRQSVRKHLNQINREDMKERNLIDENHRWNIAPPCKNTSTFNIFVVGVQETVKYNIDHLNNRVASTYLHDLD
jgi:hypothetical protein